MAQKSPKKAKEVRVTNKDNGERRLIIGQLYRRVQTVDDPPGTEKGSKARVATNEVSWLFGLRRAEETYMEDGKGSGRFRLESEARSFLGGIYKTKDVLGPERKTLESSRSTPFGSRRREALVNPDGEPVMWRTLERRVAGYSMKVEPGEGGETVTRSFGKLFGKPLFSHKTTYHYLKQTKSVRYSLLFDFVEHDKKPSSMTDEDKTKALGRAVAKESVDRKWAEVDPAKKQGNGTEAYSIVGAVVGFAKRVGSWFGRETDGTNIEVFAEQLPDKKSFEDYYPYEESFEGGHNNNGSSKDVGSVSSDRDESSKELEDGIEQAFVEEPLSSQKSRKSRFRQIKNWGRGTPNSAAGRRQLVVKPLPRKPVVIKKLGHDVSSGAHEMLQNALALDKVAREQGGGKGHLASVPMLSRIDLGKSAPTSVVTRGAPDMELDVRQRELGRE